MAGHNNKARITIKTKLSERNSRMSIELTLRYTEDEYLCSYKERMAQIPYKNLHTYGPPGIFLISAFTLLQFDTMTSWWTSILLVIMGVYSLLCLAGIWLMPKLALKFARKHKLNDTYQFSIDHQCFRRKSKQGLLEEPWGEFVSIDFYQKNVFFNLKRGSMVIPLSRLSESQLTELKGYVQDSRRP